MLRRLVLLAGIIALLAAGSVQGPRVAGGAAGFILPPGVRPAWSLDAIKAIEAWQMTQGHEEIVVAVIDSGIDRTIPALAGRMWVNPGESAGNGRDDDGNGYVDDMHGWDFRDGNPDSMVGSSLNWHGTFVAGILAASFDQATGVGGIAPRVRIMDLRFLDSRGLFYASDWPRLARAIDYAVDNGARVINISIYAKVQPPAYVHDAIRRAASHGVLIVGIAGNDGASVGFFGRYPEVLTVAAVDRHGQAASFSNTGPQVDLAAPGVDVQSYYPGGSLRTGSGTSFAAPYVAGTAALMLSVNPSLTPSDIIAALCSSAIDLGPPGRDHATGHGLLHAAAAVRATR